MNATLTTRDRLVGSAEKFAKDHEDSQGLLTAEDQETFDNMIAAAKVIPGRRTLRTQADADAAPMIINGIGSGAQLFDEKGNAMRGLRNNESFAGALRERGTLALSPRDQKLAGYIDDGELTFGGFLRAMITDPRTAGERAALSESSGSGGGYNVAPFLAAQVIDKFRARAVLMAAGATTIPLQSDTHVYCKLTGDATAGWRREGTPIVESSQTFGALQFYPKSLAVVTKISRELLQDSPNIDDVLERSFAEAFAREVDRVGLLGNGAAEPVGLYGDVGLNELTGVGAIDKYNDVLDAWKILLDDNVPDPTAFITSNREWRTYAGLSDTTNQPLARPPLIRDLPFLSTSAIPTNLGAGTESLAFLGYFPDFVFGIRSEFQIDVARELFAGNHQVGFIAHLRMDTGVMRPDSFCRLSGITP